MGFELFFTVTVFVDELPIELGLGQFLLSTLHFLNHLRQTVSMVGDHGYHFCLLAHVTVLMLAKESTVWADSDLAAREADQFLQRLVLVAEANGFFHLLFLLLLNLSLSLCEAVLKVCRSSVRDSI